MRIQSYGELKTFVGGNPRCGTLLYRGIGSQFELIPSVAYSGEKNIETLLQKSVQAQIEFDRKYRELNPDRKLSNYQLIFLARHCGLISPFIDFSFNDTIALQFGMEMAKDAMHLYIMNISNAPINDNADSIPVCDQFKIYRPNLVWKEPNFLIQEHTQSIQNARLIGQNKQNIATPLDKTCPIPLIKCEIQKEDFDEIVNEINKDGIRMDKSLLIDETDELFAVAQEINYKIQNMP